MYIYRNYSIKRAINSTTISCRRNCVYGSIDSAISLLVFCDPLWYTKSEPIGNFERGGCLVRTIQEVNKIIEELCVSMASLFPQDQIEAILFGSYARGNAEPGSDIDVLILVDASRQDISARNWQVGDMAAELLLNYGVVVSPIVENRDYFNRNIGILPFYRNVAREGVRISA